MYDIAGAFLLLLATLTVLGGVNSDWFQDRVQGPVLYVCFTCPLIIYAIVLSQVISAKNKTS